MDGGQQALNQVRYLMAQAMLSAIDDGGTDVVKRYNTLVEVHAEIRSIASGPNDHATPSRRTCQRCNGTGRSSCCAYSGLQVEADGVMPHEPDSCKTCRLYDLTRSRLAVLLRDMPQHGPWEDGYVQPELEPGRTREGTWADGTLLQAISFSSRADSSYVYFVAALPGNRCLYQYSSDGMNWDRVTLANFSDIRNYGYVARANWPPSFQTSPPIGMSRPLAGLAPGLERYLVR